MINIVRKLENKTNKQRLQILINLLEEYKIDYQISEYKTGKNVITKTRHPYYIGIGSHYDAVKGSPGANDNASAIAVGINVINYFNRKPLKNIGVKLFCFDEEEKGLIGSKAYVAQNNFEKMIGIINMELVGNGNQFILWNIDKKEKGILFDTFEHICKQKGINTTRINKLLFNSADHNSFRNKNLKNAFTITCIPEKDEIILKEYLLALNSKSQNININSLINKSSILKNYHNKYDNSSNINNKSLLLTYETIIGTIKNIDNMKYVNRKLLFLKTKLNSRFR